MDKLIELEKQNWLVGKRGARKIAIQKIDSEQADLIQSQQNLQKLEPGLWHTHKSINNQQMWFFQERTKAVISWPGGCIDATIGEPTTDSESADKALAPIRLTMPGKVVEVKIKPGDVVEKDQCLFVVEAMKMENNILALGTAKVEKVLVEVDSTLESGATLCTFKEVE